MKLLAFSVVILCLTTTNASVQCPLECECYYRLYTFLADCSGKNLNTLPSTLDSQVQGLDLSNNLFTTIPPEISSLSSLEFLNMSKNQISGIRKDALSNLTYLQILDLSLNKISTWEDINPNDLFKPAENLKTVILSKNPLQKFSNLKDSEIMVSNSIEVLEMESCGIGVAGDTAIIGLTALKTLKMGHNPLVRFKIASISLKNLDISYCQLIRLSPTALSLLPSLTHLHISHNYRLDLSTKSSSLSSTSLLYADISFCNMNRINLSAVPNLEILILRGNMIRRLTGGEFYNHANLINLDLSSNSISSIHENSFAGLHSLRHLNLSINVISSIHEETFLNTPNLTTLSLSRNLISTLNSFQSSSIIDLDLSICEIKTIDPEAFKNMTRLLIINLSRNFINHIPNGLHSNSLEQLDLSYNRISDINNSSFHKLPFLTVLNLSGNRFTATWHSSYFENNKYLMEIYLHDNTWRCDCADIEMKYLFSYLTNEPSKIMDVNSLICHSPANVSGASWMKACYFVWYPQEIESSTTKAMNFLLAVLCAFFICFVILFLIKRSLRLKLAAEQEQRRIQMEEARERFRETQMRREQEALRNAPDPRDLVSPPSYDEALLMPRLDGSFHSLSDINGSEAKKKKKARRRTRSSGDLLDENTPVHERRRRKSRDRSKNEHRKRSQSTSNMTSDSEMADGAEERLNPNPTVPMHESDL